MANAPAKYKSWGSTGFSGVAAAALTEGYCVMWDTNGKLALATSGNRVAGAAENNYSSGETSRANRGGFQLVAVTGTLVAGDYVKVSSTPGVLDADTTSGSTALSVNTVGKCKQDKDANGMAVIDFSMGT